MINYYKSTVKINFFGVCIYIYIYCEVRTLNIKVNKNRILIKKLFLARHCIDDKEEKMEADYAFSCFEEVYSFACD